MLDRNRSSSPLYLQVQQILEAEIAAGRYSPGESLPSEPGLARELAVSRATIIKAFEGLERAGLIVRRQGKGTFVAPRGKRNSLADPTSFTAVTSASGSVPSQRWLAYDAIPAGLERTGLASDFPASTQLVRLERVRSADDMAVGHHVAVLPAELLARAGVSESSSTVPDFSLYGALEAIGSRPHSAEESLRAVSCPAHVAEALGVAPSTPMMHVHRLTRDGSGTLIESVEAHYVGSLYEYHTHLISQSFEEEGSRHEEISERRSSNSVSVFVAGRVRGDDTRV